MLGAGEFLLDKETVAEIERQERLKRIGHNFIRVEYTGRQQFPRLHGFHNMGIITEYDPDQGKEVQRAVMEDRVVQFHPVSDGRMVADILDDDFNRYAISRHLDQMAVEDSRLAKEIAQLTHQPYVVEPDRKTQLLRDRRRIDAELAAMGEIGAEPEPAVRRRGRPAKRSPHHILTKPEPAPAQTEANSESSNSG